jgi:hypothetical protein
MAVLAVLALIAGLVAVPATTASANHAGALTVVVGEGFGLGANCNPNTGQGCEGFGESQRFLAPNPTNVHNGDTITFEFHGFHTATVLPANTDVQDFIDSQVKPFGAPYSLVVPDPDEGATGLKANPAVAFPSSFTCGVPAAPCPAGGNEVVNSGLPQGGPDAPPTFTIEIDGQPGDTIWVICLLHPHMRMRIKVVGNNTAATTPADVAAAHAAQTATDQDWGHAMHSKMRAKRSSHVGADGLKVWDSWVGVDNHHASLFNIYPLNLPVKRGDRVRYHFDTLTYEDHTAAVRNATTIEQANALFATECDPDGDSGSAPDTEPVDGACANPLQTEISFPFALAGPQGDGTITGRNDVEASGLRGANAPVPPTAGQASWTERFTRASDTPIPMFCHLHPFMVQRVRVRR